MNPIVPASVIYLIGIIDSVRETFSILSCLSIVVLIIAVIFYFIETAFEEKSKWLSLVNRVIKISIPATIIFGLLCTFIPKQKVLIAMVATKYVTKNSLTTVLDATGKIKAELKQDIIDIINAFEKPKSGDK